MYVCMYAYIKSVYNIILIMYCYSYIPIYVCICIYMYAGLKAKLRLVCCQLRNSSQGALIIYICLGVRIMIADLEINIIRRSVFSNK